MKRVVHKALLCLKMSFPLIGATGKVPKKEPSTHMDNPAPPIAVKPSFKIAKNTAAKARLIRISAVAVIALKCSVNFLEWTLRVGEEKGTLNANVVKRKSTRPKGQIVCSLQTPLLRK